MMKVASILGVVAYTAAQPWIRLPAQPFKPCDLIGHNLQCCWPDVYGGCASPPGMFPPGRTPQGFMPPPDFLQAVCCKSGNECCPTDQKARFPRFKCCESTQSCDIDDGKGECIEGFSGNGTTPQDSLQLDYGGQCPDDGSLPLRFGPNKVIRCSLNKFIQGGGCSTGTCVRDLTDNVNSGVCCMSSGCESHSDCVSCVTNDNNEPAPCGWLSQGSLANAAPRCISNCHNFPDKSCVLPSDGRLCPVSQANPNGTVVNTGTCDRRCNLIGTGRSSRISNLPSMAHSFPDQNATECCLEYPGDYCCDMYGHRAAHCGYGQQPGQGSLCGVPVRGTANTLYNSPSPYGPSPNPYMHGGPGYFNPMPYGPRPGPRPYGFAPRPYMGYRESEANDVALENKQLFFQPAPMYRPMSPPRRASHNIIDQRPSPFICSCDDECRRFDDCCSDYDDYCYLID